MDTKTNEISEEVHKQVPHEIFAIVNGHIYTNAEIKAQHNREILDDIIADLEQYRNSLPSIDELEPITRKGAAK